MDEVCTVCQTRSQNDPVYQKHLLTLDRKCPQRFVNKMAELWANCEKEIGRRATIRLFKQLRRGWARSRARGIHPDAEVKMQLVNRVYEANTVYALAGC